MLFRTRRRRLLPFGPLWLVVTLVAAVALSAHEPVSVASWRTRTDHRGWGPPSPSPPAPTPSPPPSVASPSVTTTPPLLVPSASGGLRIGLSYPEVLTALTPEALAQTLDDAAALGVGWIRFDLGWETVQPESPSVFDWSGFDRVIAAANARHLRMLPILDFTPAWAARAPGCDGSLCAPADPPQFAAFAGAAATRYGPLGVHDWEVWNEPNTGAWQPAPSTADYVSLLRATTPAIKAADPSAVVISGSLAPAPTSNRDISQMDFLTAFARQGGLSLVDAVGYHPYSYPVPPSDRESWNAWQQIAATPTSFQTVLSSFGFPDMKIWATEYGAPTDGPGVTATTSDYKIDAAPDHVSEDLQAVMASESVQLAKSSPLIGALFWYTANDAGTDPSNSEDFFGLRRFDGTAKPAYAALQQVIAATKP
jgi:polysaccharide biosynthesis protein PslG